uniref:Uncharacterized protein n=1 Tax=Salix viminalis TaxID=40686 RepID=A0A6N2N817_SALVM
MASPALDKSVPEILPPSLDATAEQPPHSLMELPSCIHATRVHMPSEFGSPGISRDCRMRLS